MNLDPHTQQQKKSIWAAAFSTAASEWKDSVPLKGQEMTWKRGEKIDGWKEMTLLSLSAANEMIKNKTVLVRQSNDVTSRGNCCED